MSKSILFITQDADWARIVGTLEGGEFIVTSAKDGVLEVVQRYRTLVDLIILDAALPKVDIEMITATIKTSAALRHMLLLLMLSDAHLVKVGRLIELGADDYLLRSLGTAALKARIAAIRSRERRWSRINHDLIVALTNIKGYTHLLQLAEKGMQPLSAEDSRTEYLEIILDNARDVHTKLDEFRPMEQITTGTLPSLSEAKSAKSSE